MPEKTTHAPGTFCYPEAAVEDVAKATAFYGGLLGWDVAPVPGGGYHLARRKGKIVAGMYALTGDMKKRGVPANWLSYVRVASADESADKAAGLGGKVRHAPFDLPGIGRMAMLQDTTGGLFALWEPKGMEGVGLVDEPGAPCWYELYSRDVAKAKAFYSGLFGWTCASMPSCTIEGEYTLFRLGETPVAGLMEMLPKHFEGVPPHWDPYFAVEDCDAAVKQCAALGGRVHVKGTDIPNVGRFAVLGSPDGACFSVLQAAAR
jgi:predicted enzyme related to lactoylglutathione lyase